MKILLTNLDKELAKSQKSIEKLETKYNNSKNAKNEFWGDDEIYSNFMNAVAIRDILKDTFDKLSKLI